MNIYLLNELSNAKMPDYDYTLKIMMLGDNSVDKKSLAIRYISGFFLEDLKLSIGVDFYSKTINFKGKKVKLQLWDFDGEGRFRFLLHQYCKDANAAFFLYDITNRSTLDHLPDWTQIIREHSGDIPIILVGTNLNLQAKREISKREGMLIGEKYNLSAFIEVSAETGQNVDQLFEDVIEKTILNVNKRSLKPKKVGKKRKINELEKEKQREPSLSREAYKLIQEGNQLKDKTPKEKSQGMYNAAFKIIIFGDEGCGKVEFTQRFLTNQFISDQTRSDQIKTDQTMTIGVDLEVKTFTVDGQKVKLQIWGFGGEMRYRSLLPTCVRGARGGMFLYDITNYSSIAHIDDWLSAIRKEIRAEDIFPIIVVGNRAHLVDEREVSSAEGTRIAKSKGVNGFIEVSAKTGENVKEAFEALTRLMLGGFKPRKLGVSPAIIEKIGFNRLIKTKKNIIIYINQESKTNKQITRARTIKAIKKSLKLAEKDQSWDDRIWAFTISLSKSICKRITPKTIYFDPKLLQEGTQLKDKTPKQKVVTSIRSFMNQDLKQWLETLKGLKKGCEEIIKFLKDKNEQYYYHYSFEQWIYLLRLSSELLEEFKENSSSFYKMSDDTKEKLYHLFEIFIPCREILSDGSFGKNVRVTFEEYLKILKLEKF